MYKYLNKNPLNLNTGDCVIRAISTVLDDSWDNVYVDLSRKGLSMFRILTDNGVWGAFLRDKGFIRGSVDNSCPACYTIRDFAFDNPEGAYVLGTGNHAVALIDGTYYDTSDCGDETVLYYWKAR